MLEKLKKKIKEEISDFNKGCIYMSDYSSNQAPFHPAPQLYQQTQAYPNVTSTCAVHGVIIESLQTKIDKLESGQNELKELIQHNHRETLQSFIESYGKTQDDIGALRVRLETQIKDIDTIHDRDKERFTDSIHKLKNELSDQINKIKVTYAMISGGAAVAGGTAMFILQSVGVLSKIFN